MFRRRFWKKKHPYDEETNIGNILLSMGIITEKELSKAADKQEESGGFLGEILISMGTIDRDSLDTGLRVQEQLRSGNETEANFQMAEEQLRQRKLTLARAKLLTVQSLERLA